MGMKKIVHYLILAAVLVGLPLGCAWVAGYDAMLSDVAEIAPQCEKWVNDPAHYGDRVRTHVISPFRVPKHWRIWRGFDFGYARPYSVGWYAADEDGRLYRVAELYGCTGTPNEGTCESPDRIAENIRRVEAENENLRGRTITGVADPSIFDESRGESVATMMARHPNYIYFHPGDNTRLPGKMQFHYRLAFREDGRPMLQVFSTCVHFIRTLPALTYDTRMVEDINSSQEDHIYDECRYVLMENPISPREMPSCANRADTFVFVNAVRVSVRSVTERSYSTSVACSSLTRKGAPHC